MVNAIPLTKAGAPDKRYKYDPAEPHPKKNRLPRGKKRIEGIKAKLGGRSWELVEQGYDPKGRLSVNHLWVKHYFILRDLDSGEEVTVGKGEMNKYAGVRKPRKRLIERRIPPSFGAPFKT